MSELPPSAPSRRPRTCRSLLVALMLLASLTSLGACTSDGAADAGSVDAAVLADSGAPGPDAGLADAAPVLEDAGAPDTGVPTSCTCEDRENCAGCIAHLGDCCHQDPSYMGQARLLVAGCQARPACSVCCNECVAKSCEQLIAEKACPGL